MIKACNSAGDARFVLGLLRRSKFQLKLTPRCYSFLTSSLFKFLPTEDLKAVYLEMLDDNVTPGLYTLNAMVYAYCKLGKVVEADLYLGKIITAGLRPSTFTYNCLIFGHRRNKDMDSAFRIFKLMSDKGCQRNEVSYNNLIQGLCEAGRIDEGLE